MFSVCVFVCVLGYEIYGANHVPDESPALLIIYHRTIPMDFYFLKSIYYIEKHRHIHAVTDNILFRVPGE